MSWVTEWQQPAAIAFCIVIAGLGVFQALLIAGAPLGHFAWGGQHRVLPPKLRNGSIFAIVLYVLFALAILDRAGLIALLPAGWPDVAAVVICAYLAFGTGLNAISRSLPERLVMTPVAAILFVLGLIVAIG